MKAASKRVEVAFEVPKGREGRMTPGRKVVEERKLAAFCEAVVEKGGRVLATCEVGS